MDYTALGRVVRQARTQMNMTQEKLAEDAGISASFLGHIERGTRKASLETLVSIANALRISSDQLLCDSLSNVVGINGLDKRQQKLVLQFITYMEEITEELRRERAGSGGTRE